MSGPSGRVSGAGEEIIFEITRVGDAQRVAAVHVASGVEVVVQAPAGASLADVKALALRKLERALGGGGDGDETPARPGKRV